MKISNNLLFSRNTDFGHVIFAFPTEDVYWEMIMWANVIKATVG